MDGVAVNGTLARFAQRRENHDSKQPVMVVFTSHQQTADTGACHELTAARPLVRGVMVSRVRIRVKVITGPPNGPVLFCSRAYVVCRSL